MTLLRSVLCLPVVDAPAAPDSSEQRTGTVGAVPATPERGAASGGPGPTEGQKPSHISGLIVTTSVAGLVPCAQNRPTRAKQLPTANDREEPAPAPMGSSIRCRVAVKAFREDGKESLGQFE